jgi:hypothetical protein
MLLLQYTIYQLLYVLLNEEKRLLDLVCFSKSLRAPKRISQKLNVLSRIHTARKFCQLGAPKCLIPTLLLGMERESLKSRTVHLLVFCAFLPIILKWEQTLNTPYIDFFVCVFMIYLVRLGINKICNIKWYSD